jgi:protein O-mannosyl-transferase
MERAETNQAYRSTRLPYLAILLVVLVFVAYLPALHGGFLWDDDALITENRVIKASDGLHRLWFTKELPDYYPLTESLWWLEWRVWGDRAAGYHVLNVLLHAVNALLVWAILVRLKIPGAWLTALVFALHPVNVATVAWISEQKNTLSMLFYALSILFYLHFYEKGRWRWYVFSLVAFLLALLSKSAVVMLPFVLLGCVWWTRGRVSWKDVLRSVPFFAASLVLGLFTVWFQYRALGTTLVRTDGYLFRLAAAGWVLWFYLYKAVLPFGLMVIYPNWPINASHWGSYVPGALLVVCFWIFWRARGTWGRPLLFGLGYFVVTLFPVWGFFDQAFYRFSLVADHWQYYSIVGVIALVVAAGEDLCRRMGDSGRYRGTAAAVVVLAIIGVATRGRAGVYAADETLWRDTVAKNPKAWVAQLNLGNAVQRAGRIEEAMHFYEQTLEIKPDYAAAHLDLGMVLIKLGRPEAAISHYERALQINPGFVEAHYDLGNALLRLRRYPEAAGQWEQVVRLDPNSSEAHYNLASALYQTGRAQEAIGQYEEALRIRPDYARAHYNLAGALWQVGQLQEAIGHYEQALRINPDYAEAHVNLGIALAQVGSNQDALVHFVKALQLRPDSPEVRGNLGQALFQAGRVSEAVEQFQQALRIQPDYVEAHFNLALALEKLGRTPDAIEHYQQALKLRPDFAPARNALTRLGAGQ